MSMTTSTTPPDVPLPAGATSPDGWQPDDSGPYRAIFGDDRCVTDHDAIVWTSAVQFADGAVTASPLGEPYVYVDCVGIDRGLNSDQARELAAALLEAAAELDRWAER